MDRFQNFVSNDPVKEELNAAMDNNSLPHAIIIEGARGTGKKTLAWLIAQYCVCSSDEKKPCGLCHSCIKVKSSSHPDVKIADGEADARSINVASIRELRTDAYILPNEAGKKVYLIFNCDKMNVQAQNAFLKIFEEPPENVFFVLTCLSATSLLETIRSRARILSLFPVSESDAVKAVERILPEADKSDIVGAVIKCGGNIGRTLEMLRDGSGGEERDAAERIALSLLSAKKTELLKCSALISADRAFSDRVMANLYEIFAEAVKVSAGAKSENQTAGSLADRITKKRLFALMDKVDEARRRIDRNINMNLFGAWFCSEMRI